MNHSKDFKYHFDEESGIFIRESEISINWFVSQVLGQENLQITKVSNEDIQKLLYLLDNSDLRMPNGQHSLFWLREKVKEKMVMDEAKLGEVWDKVVERFRYIIEQIDYTLIKSKNIKEKMEIKKEEVNLKPYRDPNNMTAKFEPE